MAPKNRLIFLFLLAISAFSGYSAKMVPSIEDLPRDPDLLAAMVVAQAAEIEKLGQRGHPCKSAR